MHKSLVILLLLSGFLLANHGQASPAPTNSSPLPLGSDGNWMLVFHDDFEADELDTDKWTTCYWWDDNGCTNGSTNEQQWYLPDNVFIRDGVLILQAREELVKASDGNVYEYTSGIVTTGNSEWKEHVPPRFAFQYGYTEMKAIIPAGQGLWTTFWLLPVNYDADPEFDVMEALGQNPTSYYTTVHWENENEEDRQYHLTHTVPDLSQDWHVYGMEWREDAIIWYLDGKQIASYTEMENLKLFDMYLLLNLAVGGEWAGDPGGQAEFPAEFQIDYVSVWQRPGQN